MIGTIGVPASVWASLLRPVLTTLALVAMFEMLVLRVLTRTAVFIPGIGERIAVVGVIGELGQLAYSISVVLLVLALLLISGRAWSGGGAGRTLALGLIGFAVVALMARWDWLPRIAVDAMTLVAFAVAAIAAVHQARPMVAAALLAFCAAFILAAIDGIWRNLAGSTQLPAAGGLLLWVAEWLLLGAALAAIVANRPLERGARTVGAILAGLMLVAAFLAPASLHILLLWNVGMPGAMPAVAHSVIAFAVGLTVVSAMRRRRPTVAVAVTLLLAGGIGLHSTYQSGLILVGLASIALLRATAVEPRPRVVAGTGRVGAWAKQPIANGATDHR